MEIKSDNIKITLNKINVINSFNNFLLNNLDIVFIASNKNGIENFITKDNICLFSDIKDLKRQYHGQNYLYFPVIFNNNKKLELFDEEESDIYIVVSKREFKINNKGYRYKSATEIKSLIDIMVDNFIKDINNIIDDHCYNCAVEFNSSDDDIKRSLYINNIIAKDVDEMKHIISKSININEFELNNFNFDKIFK